MTGRVFGLDAWRFVEQRTDYGFATKFVLSKIAVLSGDAAPLRLRGVPMCSASLELLAGYVASTADRIDDHLSIARDCPVYLDPDEDGVHRVVDVPEGSKARTAKRSPDGTWYVTHRNRRVAVLPADPEHRQYDEDGYLVVGGRRVGLVLVTVRAEAKSARRDEQAARARDGLTREERAAIDRRALRTIVWPPIPVTRHAAPLSWLDALPSSGEEAGGGSVVTSGEEAGGDPAKKPEDSGEEAGGGPAKKPDNSDLTPSNSDRTRDPHPAHARDHEEERSPRTNTERREQTQKAPTASKPTKAQRDAERARLALYVLCMAVPDAESDLRVIVLELTRPDDLHRWGDVLTELGQLTNPVVMETAAKTRNGATQAPWAYALTTARRAAHTGMAREGDRVRFLRSIEFDDAYIRAQGLDPNAWRPPPTPDELSPDEDW